MGTILKFEDIEAWKLARILSKEVHQLLKLDIYNSDKRLKSQMYGSSGSVMDNIAEGYGRGGNKEFSQYLWIAKGSAAELKSQFSDAKIALGLVMKDLTVYTIKLKK